MCSKWKPRWAAYPPWEESWNLDRFSPSRETIHAISPSSTRIRAITGRSRDKLECDGRFQLCGHKWLIFSLATTLVSNTIFPQWIRVATSRFRTAYTTLTRVESLADVARGAFWWFLSPWNAGNNPRKLILLQENRTNVETFVFRKKTKCNFKFIHY